MNNIIKVNSNISAFQKAFPVFVNIHVTETSICYKRQTYKFEQTVQQAKDLILKNGLSLEVKSNQFLQTIEVNVINELDRLDNAFGSLSEKLATLSKQINA